MRITKHNNFFVVRGDEVEGGIKAYAVGDLFSGIKEKTILFASNSVGYGSIAVSLALKNNKSKQALIFLSKKDNVSVNTAKCVELGAKVHFIGKSDPGDSEGLRNEAIQRFSRDTTYIVPLGVEHPIVKKNIQKLAMSLFSVPPKELWMACGSGFTIRALQEIWLETSFHGVCVKGNNPDIGKAKKYIPDEEFFDMAEFPPPYNSSPYYDAKVWRFVLKSACPGAVIWNIA